MGVDLNWQMLTDASANFGNALVNAAGTVHQRREQGRDRTALTNYLQHPDNQAAMSGLAGRNPALAFQIQDHHLEAARALRTEHQQQLDYIGQLLANKDGTPIGEAQYPQALALAQRAGIDTAGWETYDPARVGQVVELHQRLHPTAPVNVGRGDTLMNPLTGAVIGRGAPPPVQAIPVQAGGGVYIVDDSAPAGMNASPPLTSTLPETARQDGGAFDFSQHPTTPTPRPARADFDHPAAASLGGHFGTVTSNERTPEHNRAVGGVPNSNHLARNGARAFDIARHRGVSHAQVVAGYRAAGYMLDPDTRDEGDHSHIVIASGPRGGSSHVPTAQANGRTYYQVNGQWYDNPEGR